MGLKGKGRELHFKTKPDLLVLCAFQYVKGSGVQYVGGSGVQYVGGSGVRVFR